MSVESGKDGKILIGAAPIADITSWEFDKEVHTTRYGSSSTAGFNAAARRLAMGQRLSAADLPDTEVAGERLVAVRAGQEGPLVALVRLDQGVVRPVLVLAEPSDLP